MNINAAAWLLHENIMVYVYMYWLTFDRKEIAEYCQKIGLDANSQWDILETIQMICKMKIDDYKINFNVFSSFCIDEFSIIYWNVEK